MLYKLVTTKMAKHLYCQLGAAIGKCELYLEQKPIEQPKKIDYGQQNYSR